MCLSKMSETDALPLTNGGMTFDVGAVNHQQQSACRSIAFQYGIPTQTS